jgi:hypothetical protein
MLWDPTDSDRSPIPCAGSLCLLPDYGYYRVHGHHQAVLVGTPFEPASASVLARGRLKFLSKTSVILLRTQYYREWEAVYWRRKKRTRLGLSFKAMETRTLVLLTRKSSPALELIKPRHPSSSTSTAFYKRPKEEHYPLLGS